MKITKKTNKEYLLNILNALDGKRTAAKKLKTLVEKDIVNETQVMQLLHTFLTIIYESHTKIDLKKLKKMIQK